MRPEADVRMIGQGAAVSGDSSARADVEGRSGLEERLAVLDGAAALAAWQSDPSRTPFQHPRWSSSWWRAFGARGGAVPVVLESPAYGTTRTTAWSIVAREWGGVRVARLQPLGQSDWLTEAFPGEYAGLPLGARASHEARAQAFRGALDATLDCAWDELYVRWLAPDGEFAHALRQWAAARGLVLAVDGIDPAYYVDTDGPESGYRAALGEGARRALFGKRRLAASTGLEFIERVPSPWALETLFELHDARWAGGGMPAATRAFLRTVADGRLAGVDCRVSALVDRGVPVAASLNLQCAGVVWNLQGGFRPGWNARLSPGKLLLGHELERAFAATRVARFELLAGRGRSAEYKSALATGWRPLQRLRIVRSRWWRALLAMRDAGRRVRRLAQRDPAAASTSLASPANSST